jgi:VWFA-related protein
MRVIALFVAGLSAAIMTVASPMARQAPPAGSGQQTQQQQPPPTQDPQQPRPPPIKSGINFVRVDAIVTDRQGKPVLDMKQEEFRVKEDGKAQTIETFSKVDIDLASQVDAPPPPEIRSVFDEQREAARPDVRLFVILLDDYHVRRGNDMGVRKPLIDFIENQLAPADLVAIMYPLTPVTELSFTRNRRSLISAIERFEGRRFNYEPRNEFEQRYAYYPVATVERIRNEVTMGALRGAAVKLGGLREGRKAIIFVSEGFTGTLPASMNDPIAAMPGIGNPARTQPVPEVSERAEFLNRSTMVSDLSRIFEEANRNNTSIYPVDPRGLAAFEYDINQRVSLQTDQRHLEASLDTLRALADNTDGRAIINRNDLAKGMQQIIRDSSTYYLLGYNSTQAPTDGKFHRLEVETTRRGVEVRARKGYWAYTAEDAARASAPPKPETPAAISTALTTLSEPVRGRTTRMWVGTSRAESGSTKVTFVWEPVTTPPGERRPGDESPARVMLTVLTPDGRPIFRGRVPDAPAASPGAPAAATAPTSGASVSFDAPPGRLQMRMLVEGASGQVTDSSTQEVTLPDYTAVQVSFATPRVYRARTLREAQALKAGSDSLQTLDRTFSRTERLVVRVDAYAPGGVKPTVTARLLNRSGTAISDVPVQTSQAGASELELTLGQLVAGDYLLELVAKTEAGTAQEYIAFRVAR